MATISIDPSTFRLLYRHPDPPVLGSTLVCHEGQCAVFLQWGRAAGSLGPGQHVLDPQKIPFLSILLEGGKLGGELIIANTRGAALSVPVGSEPVVVTVRVADPVRMLGELAGPADPAAIEQFVIGELKAALGPAGADKTAQDAALARVREKLAPMALDVLGVGVGSTDEPKRAATQAMSAAEAAEVMAASASASASSAAAVPAPPPGPSLGPGARVRISHGGTWYSGTILQTREQHCEVEWDSGQKSWVPLAGLEPEPAYPGAHPAGTRVLAQWTDGSFYPATVRHFNGTSYQVAWDNGTSAWLSPGQVKLT